VSDDRDPGLDWKLTDEQVQRVAALLSSVRVEKEADQ
jgi:hypothetical protein